MSKITKLKKDKVVRINYDRKEMRFILYKYNLAGSKLYKHKKYFFYNFIKWFKVVYSSSRVENKCIFSGRTRWSLRRFRLSRIIFKNLCDNGKIHGVRWASW